MMSVNFCEFGLKQSFYEKPESNKEILANKKFKSASSFLENF